MVLIGAAEIRKECEGAARGVNLRNEAVARAEHFSLVDTGSGKVRRPRKAGDERVTGRVRDDAVGIVLGDATQVTAVSQSILGRRILGDQRIRTACQLWLKGVYYRERGGGRIAGDIDAALRIDRQSIDAVVTLAAEVRRKEQLVALGVQLHHITDVEAGLCALRRV